MKKSKIQIVFKKSSRQLDYSKDRAWPEMKFQMDASKQSVHTHLSIFTYNGSLSTGSTSPSLLDFFFYGHVAFDLISKFRTCFLFLKILHNVSLL